MPKVLSAADIEAFRERLCDAAEEKFAARGPEAVTMRDLADAMGVSPMTPYRYFKDKDAVFHALHTEAFQQMGLRGFQNDHLSSSFLEGGSP